MKSSLFARVPTVRRQTLLPSRWKTDRMKEKIMCWPHWLVQSNISDQSVKEWICIRVRGVCCLYRWSLYDSCSQGRVMWPIAHRKHVFSPFFFFYSSDRGRRIEFQVISLVSQDWLRSEPQSVTRPRGKQLLDTGARRRREKRRCCGWDPSSGVIWVKARSWLEPSDSTRTVFDSGRWHGELPAHHVTRVRCCPTSQAGQDSLLRSPQMLFWEAYWNKSGEPHGRITWLLLFKRDEHSNSLSQFSQRQSDCPIHSRSLVQLALNRDVHDPQDQVILCGVCTAVRTLDCPPQIGDSSEAEDQILPSERGCSAK